MPPPGRREFLKAFYEKYAPAQQLTEERFNAIDQKYGDDHQSLIKDLYSKYAPNEQLPQERINAIQSKYELNKIPAKPIDDFSTFDKKTNPQDATNYVKDNTVDISGFTSEQIKNAKPADSGFFSSLGKTIGSGLTDQLPKEYYTQRLRMSKGTLADAFDPRSDINAFDDQLEKLGLSRDEYSKWNNKQPSEVRTKPLEEKVKNYLTEKLGPEGYEKLNQQFQQKNTEERLGYEKQIQEQNKDAEVKLAGVTQNLKDVDSAQKLLGFLGNSMGQALYRVPTSVLTGTTGSIVSESSAIYDRQLDLLSEKTGKSREQLIKENLDQPAAAQALSVLAGSMDAVSAGGLLGMFRRAASKELTNSLLKSATKEFVKGGVFEGLTETGQGEIEEKAASMGAGTNYIPDAWRIATSFSGGFFGGGPLSTASHIVEQKAKNGIQGTDTGTEGSKGNGVEEATGEPIQRNAEQSQEQSNQTPVQQSFNETGQTSTTGPASVLKENTNLQGNEKGISEGNQTERLPQGGQSKSNRSYEKDAEDVVTGVQRANSENAGQQKQTKQKLRSKEESALEDFAKKTGTWIEDPYKKYGETPHAYGSEQIVYLHPEENKVTKINSGVMHDTWKDFIDRIKVHNQLDPSVPYKLVGFTRHSGDFAAVVEQPLVKGQDASYDEIKEDLSKKGFKRAGNTPFDITTFHNPEMGITLKDIHNNNVIKDDEGNLHYIDPQIEPFDESIASFEDSVDQKTGEIIPRKLSEKTESAIKPEVQRIKDELIKANKIVTDDKGNVTDVKQNSGQSSQLFKDLEAISGDKGKALNEYLGIKDDEGDFKKKFGDWENRIMKTFGRSGYEYKIKVPIGLKGHHNDYVWSRQDANGNPIIYFNKNKIKREKNFKDTKRNFHKDTIRDAEGTPEQKAEYTKLYDAIVNKLRDIKLHLIHQVLIEKMKGSPATIEDKINSLKEIERLNEIPLAKDYYGEPMIFMHGGSEKIGESGKFLKRGDKGYVAEDEMTNQGIYFSRAPKGMQGYARMREGEPGKGKDIYYTFLKTKNPYYMSDPKAQKDYKLESSETISKKDVEALKAKGYDSVIWDKDGVPKKEMIVFDPDQVEIIGSFKKGLKSLQESQSPEASKEGVNQNQPNNGEVNQEGQRRQENVLSPQEEAVNKQPLSKDSSNGPISNQNQQQVSEPAGAQPSVDQANQEASNVEGTTSKAGEGVKELFSKVSDLYEEIQNTEGSSKKRKLANERRKILESNPSIKYIDDRISNIYRELETKGVIKKTGNCP